MIDAAATVRHMEIPREFHAPARIWLGLRQMGVETILTKAEWIAKSFPHPHHHRTRFMTRAPARFGCAELVDRSSHQFPACAARRGALSPEPLCGQLAVNPG